MPSLYRVGDRQLLEQKIVRYMRSDTDMETGEGACFIRLGRAARAAGFRIPAVTAPFLSDDEVRLLARIAQLQRELKDGGWAPLPAGLRAEVERCARHLDDRDIRLPYATIQRMGFADGQALRR